LFDLGDAFHLQLAIGDLAGDFEFRVAGFRGLFQGSLGQFIAFLVEFGVLAVGENAISPLGATRRERAAFLVTRGGFGRSGFGGAGFVNDVAGPARFLLVLRHHNQAQAEHESEHTHRRTVSSS
jgi:hypothetical protein